MTTAVLLAGGEGTRLRPLTVTKPKPLVRVLNVPVLTYNLTRVRNIGIKDVKVTLHYLPQLIISEYGDGSELNLNIGYSIEERPLGTAGGVREALGETTERVIVVSGDLITDLSLSNMLEFHKKKGAAMTIALSYSEEPYQFGIAKLDEEGRITRYLEKPSPSEVFSNFINAGMYILEPEVLKLIPRSTEFDFSRDLIPILLSKGEAIFGFYSEAFWRDIGTIQQYLKCNHELLAGASKELYEIATKNQTIAKDYRDIVEPSLINGNATIKQGAKIGPFTVIDEEVTIGKNTILTYSLICKGVYIGDRCSIASSIIDRYAKIDDKVTIFENCVIGERTVVNRGVEIRPNIRIWPDKVIDENLTVTSNIVTLIRIPRPMFTQSVARFAINTEITPELSAKFGRAIASTVKNKDAIALSTSSKTLANLIGFPISSGIISTGVNVENGGIISAVMSRIINRLTKIKYNLYITSSNKSISEIMIYLLDEEGISINEKIEKKIENIFYREEFRLVDIRETGKLNTLAINDLIEAYIELLNKVINNHSSIEIYFLIGKDFQLRHILEKIRDKGYPIFYIYELAELPKEKKDSFITVEPNHELSKIEVYNEHYEKIDEGKKMLLEILAGNEIANKKEVFIPPYICDEIIDDIKDLGLSVKTEDIPFRDYSRILTRNNVALFDPNFGTAFHPLPYFDGLTNSILLGAYLRNNKTTLEKLMKELPNHFLVSQFEDVTIDKIPKILHELAGAEKAKSLGSKLIFEYEEAKCGVMPSLFGAGLDIIASSTEYESALFG